MQWVEPSHTKMPGAAVLAKLAQMAADREPDSPWSILAQANSAFSVRDYARSAELYAAAAGRGAGANMDWYKFARCHLEIGRPQDALAVCDQGFAMGGAADYNLRMQAGFAHSILRNGTEARQHFLAAAELGNKDEACWYILRELAQSQDAKGIFALCDELEERFGPSSVFTANRALAYSMNGDESNAARLVDLDRHVRVGLIDEFFAGDIEELNEALQREAIMIGEGNGSRETTIVPTPDLSGSPAIQLLQSIVRTAIEAFLAEADERGIQCCVPLPLEKAWLSTGVTLLRRNGRNGQHIHMTSVISAVYHIGNLAGEADRTDAGALQIGPANQYAVGHDACWGERRILPQPGQLTIFPAHFFHDVIPTMSDHLRVSFPSDVHLVP